MKKNLHIRLLCTLILATLLLGSCSAEWRGRHSHPDDGHHQDMNRDNHIDDHH